MCGILGVVLSDSLQKRSTEVALSMLTRLQHRGQDAAGLTVLPPDKGFRWAKGLGHISSAMREAHELPEARSFVGHTRYATTGKGGVAEVQPFVAGKPRLAMAHNGNLVNAFEVREKFDLQVESDSDLEVLQQFFLKFEEELGLKEALRKLYETFVGSYAVVGLTEKGDLFAFRDPHGIRPLFVYRSEHITAVASETSALQFLNDFEKEMGLSRSSGSIEEVPAASWVHLAADGVFTEGSLETDKDSRRFCMFELVYFSSPQSEYDKQSTYRYRFNMGQVLAQEILSKLPIGKSAQSAFDYVVPVPETSRSAAIAVAETLGIPYREYLVKNPYAERTFILSSQESRLKALESKLSLIGPEVKGQKILLVDDSVVRGNTSRLMAKRLREAGAMEISMASACPPIRHGCFYGIDFPDEKELVAADNQSEESVARKIGLENVFYLSVEGLKKAVGTSRLCTGCLDGEYPTGKEAFEAFLNRRRSQRGEERFV
jgi:amidophosphoribosyltransferase